MPDWAVDVGNTRIKAARLDAGGRLAEVLAVDPAVPDLPVRGRVAVLSVSPPHLEALLARLAGRAGLEVRVLGMERPVAIENRTRRPEEVGLDRLANAAAAHGRAGGAAVVADVGSAITVDAVDASGAFLGGAIAPGPRAALEGIRARARHLPDPGRISTDCALGRTTVEAMANALGLGFAGLVDRLVEGVAAEVGGAPRLFLTGGGADALLPGLRAALEPVPHLTLEGIRLLAEREGF